MQYPFTTLIKSFSNQFHVHQKLHNKLNPQALVEPIMIKNHHKAHQKWNSIYFQTY